MRDGVCPRGGRNRVRQYCKLSASASFSPNIVGSGGASMCGRGLAARRAPGGRRTNPGGWAGRRAGGGVAGCGGAALALGASILSSACAAGQAFALQR